MAQKVTPTAVVARWLNEGRTEGYTLQADGTLLVSKKQHAADIWSPPRPIGKIGSCIASFEEYLNGITSA